MARSFVIAPERRKAMIQHPDTDTSEPNMLVYFFRHGPAEELRASRDHDSAGGDAARALTPRGVEKTALAAQGLAKLIDKPDAIFTSVKTRAAQTADLLSDVLGVSPRVLPVLAEGSDTSLARAISRMKHKRVVLVGHEPTLSQTIGLLCAGEGCRVTIDLKKAGCACVEVESRSGGTPGTPRAKLLWLASPRMLRKLAR